MEHSPLSMVIDTAMIRTREMLMMQIMTTVSVATTDGTLSAIYGDRYSNVCLLVAYRPSNMRVYLRDGSAQTILRAATRR